MFSFTPGHPAGTYTDYACGRQSGTYVAFVTSHGETVGQSGVIFALPGKFSRVRTVRAWHERCSVSVFQCQWSMPLLLTSASPDNGKLLSTQTAPTCGPLPTAMAPGASTPTMARPSSISVCHAPRRSSPFARSDLTRNDTHVVALAALVFQPGITTCTSSCVDVVVIGPLTPHPLLRLRTSTACGVHYVAGSTTVARRAATSSVARSSTRSELSALAWVTGSAMTPPSTWAPVHVTAAEVEKWPFLANFEGVNFGGDQSDVCADASDA